MSQAISEFRHFAFYEYMYITKTGAKMTVFAIFEGHCNCLWHKNFILKRNFTTHISNCFESKVANITYTPFFNLKQIKSIENSGCHGKGKLLNFVKICIFYHCVFYVYSMTQTVTISHFKDPDF